ncbi:MULTISPECIES: SDR family oxidoreductase [unclassified Roseitalea]|uniref:SDR family NAD(P)-dependent oxidoreductase n=1 Tax=unclassified Roseitalea TaxID=2639107 RepID=UPI00273D778F|nr:MULTISPECIES: SDR family oxidoreductase [unclassified Roseitalea]
MRVALVTGAAGGIGRSVCDRLVADGLVVVGLDRDGDDAVRVCDVTDETAVRSCFDAVETDKGLVSVLVACAGIMPGGRAPRPLAETPLEEWNASLAVNTTGTFLCLREFLARRRARRVERGRAVLLSSAAAQLGGYRGSAAYVASKAALLGLTKIAAREAAALGVTVNAVAAGPVETPMFEAAMDPGAVDGLAARIPLGRIGAPDDVAGAVSYLVSADADWVTGATLDVNGGYRMQ